MAYTAEGRDSFIDSLMDLMDQYTWIDGIDIDWEFPGHNRASEGAGDEGCPRFGTEEEDKTNYSLLLKEMREAFDAKYGKGKKIITVCASPTSWGNSGTDWSEVKKYVDTINIMTYDFWGSWASTTGFNSDLPSVKDAVSFYTNTCSIPASKLTIGAPYYAQSWRLDTLDESTSTIGQSGSFYSTDFSIADFKRFEKENGWVVVYDEDYGASYMYNNDPGSEHYKLWISYESERALKAKTDYINDTGLAEIIIWEICQEDLDNGSPMTTVLSKELRGYVKKPETKDEGEVYQIIKKKKVQYIVDANGSKIKNKFVTINGKMYRTNKKGAILKKQLIKVKGKKYYADKKGVIAVNKKVKVDGVKYKANSKGVLKKCK